MVISLIVVVSIVCVWIWCMLFMLAIIEGGHRFRGHGYEQKLYSRSTINTQNIEDSIKKEEKKATRIRRNQYLPRSEIV